MNNKKLTSNMIMRPQNDPLTKLEIEFQQNLMRNQNLESFLKAHENDADFDINMKFSIDLSSSLSKFFEIEAPPSTSSNNNETIDTPLMYPSPNTTALIYCACHGNLDSLRFLLQDKRINTTIVDNLGNNALYYTVQQSHVHCFKLLVEHDKFSQHIFNQIVRVNYCGHNILMNAASRGHDDILTYIVELFQKHGKEDQLDINHKNYQGNTALMFTLRQGCTEVPKSLLTRDICWVDGVKHQLALIYYQRHKPQQYINSNYILDSRTINDNHYYMVARVPHHENVFVASCHFATIENHLKSFKCLLNAPNIDLSCHDCHGDTIFHFITHNANPSGMELVSVQRFYLQCLEFALQAAIAN